MADLIPCPVCGGRLLVGRRGTDLDVDCAEHCRSHTDPALYEELRMRERLLDLHQFLTDRGEAWCRGSHAWVEVEDAVDLRMLVCRRCLAVTVVAG